MIIISGNIKPKAEEKTLYELNFIIPEITSTIFSPNKEEDYTWTLYKSVNNQWRKVENNIKYGKKNYYTFGQRVVGISFKIVVYGQSKNLFNQVEDKLIAELIVTPRTAKEPIIGRVLLLNRENSDVNKAKFNEHLIAQARTSNLLGKQITFYLWDEGASEIQKYLKPKKAYVNKNGIAEVKFSLSEYASPTTFMDFFGGKNATKKFYVTAVYEGKKVNNKTPVIASSEQPQKSSQQPKSPKTPEKKEENLLSKGVEIIAEGIGSFIAEIMNTGVSAAQVNPPKQGKSASTCICKEQYKDLIWGGKVSCEFRKKIVQICAELWGESRKIEMANGLMAVIKVETSGSFKAQQVEGWRSVKDPTDMTIKDFWKNGERKSSSAIGLIQFTQEALQKNLKEYVSNPSLSIEQKFDELNKLKLTYARMGEIKQLDKVKKYFSNIGGIKMPEDIYLAVFAPKGVGKTDGYILYKGGTDEYYANKSVDIKSTGQYKNDGDIQRAEILERFHNSKKEGANAKAAIFLCSNGKSKVENNKESGYYTFLDGSIKYIECDDNINYFVQTKVDKNEFKKIATLTKNTYGMVKFPSSGTGFNRYGTNDKGGNSGKEIVGVGDHYLLPKTIAALFGIINEVNVAGWEIHFGDMSSENGSDPWQSGSKHHAGHGHMGSRKGLDIDFRYLNKSGISFQGLNTSSNFDKIKNNTVFKLGHKYGFRKNYASGMDDYKKYGVNPKVGGHYDHGHFGLSDINLKTVSSVDAKIIE